jgi:hypothetical protein
MPVATDKCFRCSNRARPSNLDVTGYQYLKPNGSCGNTEFWFCSINCYQAEVSKTLEREFDYDRCFADTDEYDQLQKRLAKAQEYYEWNPTDCSKSDLKWARGNIVGSEKHWLSLKSSAIYKAENKLNGRLFAEHCHAYDKESEEMDEQRKKRHAEDDKIFADKMLGFARQKEREDRELQKEQEKARKQQEADALKQAEEDRWKPRHFKP